MSILTEQPGGLFDSRPPACDSIAGMNKVATTLEGAFERARTMACPPNAVRLDKKTPCAATGKCGDCLSPDCFCNQIVVTRRSGHTGRIKSFLVAKDLGF